MQMSSGMTWVVYERTMLVRCTENISIFKGLQMLAQQHKS
jgi:hypothetical protein